MATLAPILGSGGAAAFERPVDSGSTAMQGAAAIVGTFLGGIADFNASQPRPRQPTQDELFGQAFRAAAEQQGDALSPENPNYRANLREFSAAFIREYPEYAGQMNTYLNTVGIPNTLSANDRIEEAQVDDFVKWITETPEGQVAHMLATTEATTPEGTRDDEIYYAALDQAYANDLVMQAELARLNREAEFATDRATVSQGYWDAYQLNAENIVSGVTTEIFDMVEAMRVDPTGSITLSPEMAQMFGVSTTTITAENFSLVLSQFRTKLRVDVINSLLNRSDVNSANILAPDENWVNQVLAPIDQIIAAANQDFNSLTDIQAGIESSITVRAIRDAWATNPELMQQFQRINMIPEDLRLLISQSIFQREGIQDDISSFIFVLNAAPNSVQGIEEIAERSSADVAEDAAIVSTYALEQGAQLSDIEFPNHFISMFANQNRVDPSAFLGQDTFRAVVTNNAQRLTEIAQANPEFSSAAQGYLSEDLAKTLTQVQSISSGYAGVQIQMSEEGILFARAAPISTEEQEDWTRFPVGIDPAGMREVQLEAIREQLNIYNIKVLAYRDMGDFGGTIIDTIVQQNTNMIPLIGGEGTTESRGDPGQDTLNSYTLPETIAGDTQFLESVSAVSEAIGANPEWLLAAMHFETGGTFDPAIRNAGGSSATGLIQFLSSTAEGLGTTTEDLAQMSRVEQMEYVQRYLEPFAGRLNNFGDVYMAIHYPVAVGKEDSFVIYNEGSDAYNANAGLDTNSDGTVTRGEAVARAAERAGMSALSSTRGVGSRIAAQRQEVISPPSRPPNLVITEPAMVRPRSRPESLGRGGETPTTRPQARPGVANRMTGSQASTKKLSDKAIETLLKNGFTKEDLDVLGIY